MRLLEAAVVALMIAGSFALACTACAPQSQLPSTHAPAVTPGDHASASTGLRNVVSTHGLYSLSYPASWKVVPDAERKMLDVVTPDTSAEVTVSGDFNVATNGPGLIEMVMQRVLPGAEQIPYDPYTR